jgi:hypothetical protein
MPEDLAVIDEVAFVAAWMDVKATNRDLVTHFARRSSDAGEPGLAVDPTFAIPNAEGQVF